MLAVNGVRAVPNPSSLVHTNHQGCDGPQACSFLELSPPNGPTCAVNPAYCSERDRNTQRTSERPLYVVTDSLTFLAIIESFVRHVSSQDKKESVAEMSHMIVNDYND